MRRVIITKDIDGGRVSEAPRAQEEHPGTGGASGQQSRWEKRVRLLSCHHCRQVPPRGWAMTSAWMSAARPCGGGAGRPATAPASGHLLQAGAMRPEVLGPGEGRGCADGAGSEDGGAACGYRGAGAPKAEGPLRAGLGGEGGPRAAGRRAAGDGGRWSRVSKAASFSVGYSPAQPWDPPPRRAPPGGRRRCSPSRRPAAAAKAHRISKARRRDRVWADWWVLSGTPPRGPHMQGSLGERGPPALCKCSPKLQPVFRDTLFFI